jgi:hypothetical protein
MRVSEWEWEWKCECVPVRVSANNVNAHVHGNVNGNVKRSRQQKQRFSELESDFGRSLAGANGKWAGLQTSERGALHSIPSDMFAKVYIEYRYVPVAG